MTLKGEPPQVGRYPICYWRRAEKQAPEGMKRLSQNRNNARLRMCLVVKVQSYAVKSLKCSTRVQSQKRQNDLCFQGKPFIIIVIQVYAPTINAKEAEVEWFYENVQDLLELTSEKDILFIIGDWNAKVGSQETHK